jgi:hypothetical protein
VAQRALFAEAPVGSENRTILDGFTAHMFSGRLHGTPPQPRPQRPEEAPRDPPSAAHEGKLSIPEATGNE